MKVVLYTINSSPFCLQAKDYFNQKGIVFEEKDVELNKDNLHEMLTVSDHFAGVPFVHVVLDDGTEKGLRGFTQGEYDEVFAPVNPASTINSTPVASEVMPPVAVEPTIPATTNQESLTNPSSPVDPVIEDQVPVENNQADQATDSQLGSIMDSLKQKSDVVESAPQDPVAPVVPVVPTTPDTATTARTPLSNTPTIPDFPK